MSNDNVPVGRSKRPLSVWVLCIGNGLLAAFLIATSLVAEDRGFSGVQAAVAGISGLGISIAAHATWFGSRIGRKVLIGLLTLFLGLLIAQSVMVIVWAAETGYHARVVDAAWTRAALSLVWLCANYLLLFGNKAKAFFG
jgi:hypothetical protein